jgi:hypothetical protein
MAGTFETFAALHVPGDPVVLYNIWDVGSALAVIAAGAKALATGSHPVADANGFPDGQQVPIDVAANVCGVSVSALAASIASGTAGCTATTTTPQLTQAVQQQIASGGSVTGGPQTMGNTTTPTTNNMM